MYSLFMFSQYSHHFLWRRERGRRSAVSLEFEVFMNVWRRWSGKIRRMSTGIGAATRKRGATLRRRHIIRLSEYAFGRTSSGYSHAWEVPPGHSSKA